jgi:hypothetical protein
MFTIAQRTENALQCPVCRATEVAHLTGDQYRCQCGKVLRLVLASGGPTFAPRLAIAVGASDNQKTTTYVPPRKRRRTHPRAFGAVSRMEDHNAGCCMAERDAGCRMQDTPAGPSSGGARRGVSRRPRFLCKTDVNPDLGGT